MTAYTWWIFFTAGSQSLAILSFDSNHFSHRRLTPVSDQQRINSDEKWSKISHNTSHTIRRSITLKLYRKSSFAGATLRVEGTVDQLPKYEPLPPIPYLRTTVLGTWALPWADSGVWSPDKVTGQWKDIFNLDQERGSSGPTNTNTWIQCLL